MARDTQKRRPQKAEGAAARRVVFMGLDLSLTHGAIVLLDDWDESDYRCFYYVEHKKYLLSKTESEVWQGVLMPPYNRKSDVARRQFEFIRLEAIEQFVRSVLNVAYGYDFNAVESLRGRTKVYANIEAALVHVRGAAISQLIEVGRSAKRQLYVNGACIREADPISLHMWATNSAHCLKKDMVISAYKTWDFAVPERLLGTKKKKVKAVAVEEFDGPGTDLADAFWLANMVATEYALKKGHVTSDSLEPYQIRVVNRVTKTQPDGLLNRHFVHRLGGRYL